MRTMLRQPDLEERLQGETSLHHRVDVRVRLQPLDLANTTAYVYHRLAGAGGQPSVAPPAAADAIHKYSRGRPRIINTLMDNALFEAFLAGQSTITPDEVERAASDLAIGPDPGSTHTHLAPPQQMPPELAGAFDQPIPPPQPTRGAPDDVLGTSGGAYQTATSDQGTVISSGNADFEGIPARPSAAEAELTKLFDADLETPAEPMPSASDELPVFHAENATGPASAEATQIVLGDEVEFMPAEPAVQDLDDLFVELIEE